MCPENHDRSQTAASQSVGISGKRKILRVLFRVYTWVDTLFWFLMNLLPPIVRRLVFMLALGGIGRGTTIDYGTYIRYPKKVHIGAWSTVNRCCSFLPSFSQKDGTITIGNHVAIAMGVTFLAAGHNYKQVSLPDTAAPICVGDHAWIGANATILPGVSIGEGAVIGAGSVVSRDIPAWSVAVGIPCRVIKERELEEEMEG